MRCLAVLLCASFAIGSAYAQEESGPCVPPELSSDRARHFVLLETFKDTDREIRDVRFSPDGGLIAAVANDGRARIWRIDTGQIVMRSQDMGSPIWHGAFSDDGRRLLTYVTGERARFYVWDVVSGEGHETQDQSVSYGLMTPFDYRVTSPDGTRAYEPGRLYDPRTQADVAPIRSAIGNATPLFSRDNRVFMLGAPFESRAFDAETGGLVARLCNTSNELPPRVSANGRFLASAVETHPRDPMAIGIWDASDGALLGRVTAPNDSISAIDISPDGQRIVTGSRDGRVRVWRVEIGAGEAAVPFESGAALSPNATTHFNIRSAIAIAVTLFAAVLVVGLVRRRTIKRD